MATVPSALLLVGSPASPSAAPARRDSTLTVSITGFRNSEGRADALLFRGPAGFPDDPSKAIDKEEAAINPKTLTAQITFRGVAPGQYAVSVLHDENMNRKMDTDFAGIPKEGYGTSNNPKKAHRAPKFAESVFSIDRARQAIQIRLIYW